MKFSGVTILQGVEFSIFPIDFEWALQQCSATALPVILCLKFGCMVFEICERTDRQTDKQPHRHADSNTLLSYRNKVIIFHNGISE